MNEKMRVAIWIWDLETVSWIEDCLAHPWLKGTIVPLT